MHCKTDRKERGSTLVEFAIAGTVFFTALFGVIECGRLLWTHNALEDAARRGARYGTIRKNDAAGMLAVQKMVVYGDPFANPGTATPVVSGLTTSDVVVTYSNYNGIQLSAIVSVSIPNYQFRLNIPMVGGTITLPPYRTSLPGESAGYIPNDIPNALPMAPNPAAIPL
jgi:Flp pilus assembly protein TadG